ncbi:MAG: hypothetical protein K0Q72_111 [Armatimonadetes bacterium]|jgi:hypothetical protein|nr:hypothetical protein [Armatimonadota bacterium]
MKRWFWLLALGVGISARGVGAEEPVSPREVPAPVAPAVLPTPEPPAAPAVPAPVPTPARLRAADDTLPVVIRDDRRRAVTLRIPRSLHRDANRFRLYGARPLTLWSHDRRKDLYRDAFLELATYSRLTPTTTTAWDSVSKQWSWLASQNPELRRLGAALPAVTVPAAFQSSFAVPRGATGDLLKDLASKPGYPQLSALLKSLAGAGYKPEGAEPMLEALQLRALATDEAARRLTLLGETLQFDAPGTDPALKEGYLAARSEFEQVRQGLWPAVALSIQKNQGRLMLSAAKQIVLSRVGWWAIFGQLAWQGAESTLSAEYRGQYAITLATLATRLGEQCASGTAAGNPERLTRSLPLAVYSEYALNYQLTEALKTGQVMGLKPSGGIGTMEWQLRFSDRCNQLRAALGPGTSGIAASP